MTFPKAHFRLMKTSLLFTGLMLLSLQPVPGAQPPNILFLLADDQRQDTLG